MARGFMSIREAAEELGVNSFTVRRWIKSGKLEAIRMGEKLWRIRPDAIERFLEASKAANQEPDQTQAVAIQRAQAIQAAVRELAAMAEDRLLTYLEVAKLTALKPGSVQKARQRGQLNGVLYKDRHWLYKPQDVIAWLQKRNKSHV